MAAHNDLGKWGEHKAEEFLRTRGYRIVEHNWRYGHRDIDIVAAKDDVLVIVEVKTRRNNLFTEPEDAVDWQKIRSLSVAANAFVKRYRIDMEVRFDVITVIGDIEGECQINHIEDAFLPIPIWKLSAASTYRKRAPSSM